MTVELIAHFADMVEQLMIAKGLDHPEEIVEQAVQAMYATLSDEQRAAALDRMVEDGFKSGVYPGDPFAEILAELDAEQRLEDQQQHRKAAQAA